MLPGSRVPRSEAEAAAAATASTSVSPPFSPSRSPQAHLRRRRRRSLASLLAESEAESEATHGGEGREVVGQLLPASLPALRPSGAPHRPGGGEGASEFRRRCEMDVVCEVCGDVGYRHLLVQCNSCKNATRHRGIMKIGQEYIYLAAHLSNQACKKVRELSLSLPPVMKVTKHSKLKAWPSRWEASELTSESIGLYFFSDNMRPNKELDRLVQYVADHNIVLKYVFGLSKLLIFSSVLLPEQCQTLQGKHYLWGVFRRRSGRSKAASQAKQKVSTSHATEKKDHQDKVQDDTQDQERPVSKVQSNTQDQEIPVSKGTIPSEGQPSPGDVHDVGTEVDPSGHRKPANSEALPTKLIVVAQTPRSEQFIKELENEGALVFAVKGLMKPGIVRLSASNAVGPELTSDNDGPAS